MDLIIRRKTKLKILIEGWFKIPHSYAVVNCQQVIQLIKHHSEVFDIYVTEKRYYDERWKDSKKDIFPEQHSNLIDSLKQWKGEEVDMVYRMTFPYDITVTEEQKSIPICVFFTAEFANLSPQYFLIDGKTCQSDEQVRQHLERNNNLYFHTPSSWSAEGIVKYVNTERVSVIPHGVDMELFKRHRKRRQAIRQKYNFKDNEMVLMNIGSMTGNKGVMEMLMALKLVIFDCKQTNVKLLLKGTQDLYKSREFLQSSVRNLETRNLLTESQTQILLTNHIVFTESTLTFEMLNELYNAADLYLSPYLAEGFNLTVLEALTSGVPVIVSQKGSTEKYIADILEHVPEVSKNIIQIPCEISTAPSGNKINMINVVDIANLIVKNVDSICQGMDQDAYEKLRMYITRTYSWKGVVENLVRWLRRLDQINLSKF